MSSLSEMTPAELDRAACEAVGIEPIGYTQVRDGIERHFSPGNEWVCDKLIAKEGGTKVANSPPVSQDPAARAMLEEAAIKAGANRIEIVITSDYAQAQILGHRRIWSRVYCADSETPKERAVALAVVAWAQAIEEQG